MKAGAIGIKTKVIVGDAATLYLAEKIAKQFGGGTVDVPIETASANGVPIPIVNKNIDIIIPTKTSDLTKDDVYTKSETYTQTEINNKLSAVYKYKFSVDYYSELPLVHENGDTYNVRFNDDGTDSGANYAWSNELNGWDSLGGLIGLATLTENGLLSKEDFALLRNLYTADEINQLLLSFAKLSGGNTFADAQNFDGRINHKVGEYFYTAASKTADTVNDTRVINSAGVEIHSVCTALGATKGSGTWVEVYRVDGVNKTTTFTSTDNAGVKGVSSNYYGGIFQGNSGIFINATSSFIIYAGANFYVDVLGNIFSAGNFTSNGHSYFKIGKYRYEAVSATSDTINDIRTSNNSGVKIEEICTEGSVVKGGGTWVTLYNIGDSHGFISPPNTDNFTITNIGNSITLTLLPNVGDYKINSKLYKNTGLSLIFTATVGQNFININSSGLFKDTGISIEDLTKIPCVTINWDGTNAILADELHKASRNLAQHQKEHDTDGARWVSGLATTFGAGAANTFSASSGVIRDEERYHTIGAKTQCRISYRNAGLTAMITDAPSTAFAKLNGGIARYDNNGVLTDLPNNQYGTYYMYATNRKLPINSELVCVMGQGSYSTIALAQAAPQPTLAGMTVAEWKLMYVIIVRRTAALPFGFIQADDKRLVTTGLAVSGSGITSLPAASITEVIDGNVQVALDNIRTSLGDINTILASI